MRPGKLYLKFNNASNPQKLIVTWALYTTPGAEIDRMVYNPPHSETALTIVDLEPIMHRVTFWQSSDGVTLETFLCKMDLDAGGNSQLVVYEYVVDRGNTAGTPGNGDYWADPVAAGTEVDDERLIGTTFYIQRRGIGFMRDDEIVKDNVLGKWSLIGLEFENADTFFAMVQASLISGTGGSSSAGGGVYEDVIQISGTENLTTDMYGKFLEVITSASSPVPYLAVPAFASIPAKKKVLINTHAMTGRYFSIKFSGTEKAKVNGIEYNVITLGKGEECELLFTGSGCKVLRAPAGYDRVGNVNPGRGIEKNIVNMDGTTYQIADFPRLYGDFISQLPAAQIKTMTAWALQDTTPGSPTQNEYPNKGFFAVDLIAGTFKVPDLRNRYFRFLKLDVTPDTTRFTDHSGGLQMDSVKSHNHTMTFKKGKSDPTESGTQDQYFRWISAGGNNYGTQDQDTNTVGSTENLTRNIGFIPQIFI